MSVAIENQFTTSRSHYLSRPVTASTYRRRRAVVALVFLTFALALSFILSDTSVAAEQAAVDTATAQKFVIAQTGDTLWSIAQRVDPYGNITLLVDQLVIINGGKVVPGQKIIIP